MVVVRLGKLRTSRLPAANESAPAHGWCDVSFVFLLLVQPTLARIARCVTSIPSHGPAKSKGVVIGVAKR